MRGGGRGEGGGLGGGGGGEGGVGGVGRVENKLIIISFIKDLAWSSN